MDIDDRWSTLGTNGAHIEIVEYRCEWPRTFELERATILEKCSPWVIDVHHVGSTAVPGLPSKPILDILPVVGSPAAGERAVEPMRTLGYLYRGENGIPGRFNFDRIVDDRTVVHNHMFPEDHPDVAKMVGFRDHLRTHTEEALEYARLKQELASRFRNERAAYTDSKEDFINRIVSVVLAEQ